MLLRSRIDVSDRRVVVDGLGVHRSNNGDVVDNGRNPRQEIGVDPRATFAATFKVEHRSHARKRGLPARHGGQTLALADRFRKLRAVDLTHCGLVVEEVNVARTAGQEQVDDPLRPGLKVGQARQSATRSRVRCRLESRGFRIDERCERYRAEAYSRSFHERSAIDAAVSVRIEVRGFVVRLTHRISLYRVRVSSRLSSILATMVQAACLAMSSEGSRGVSPFERSFWAAAGSARYLSTLCW